MTTATFYHDQGMLGLRVEGHAGYAEAGADIVCAACSIVAQALAESLRQGVMTGAGTLKWEKGDGMCVIEWSGAEECAYHADAKFHMAYTAFEMLEKTYPDNVRTAKPDVRTTSEGTNAGQ